VSGPVAVPDGAVGPAPTPGRPDRLLPGLVRLTAPNPGMMTGPGTNTYLIGTGDLAVVDPGPDDAGHRQAILAAAEQLGGAVRWVLTTHTHPDHAPGARPLADASGAETVGFGARDGFEPDRPAADGWTLDVPPYRVRAVHTPGHAANHLCWLLEEPRYLLSGDHVMEGATVVIRPPDGDMAAYLDSLDRLLELDPPLAAIGPGHGRLIDEPATVVRGIVAHRLAREEVVADALAAAGRATVDDLLPAVYADVDSRLFPVARNSLWAHLRKLAVDGRATAPSRRGRDRSHEPRGDPAADDETQIDGVWSSTPTTRR
jgi:glyoxylase-like metal-dependent hydrolase (beta-lactamase superfamily II)